MSAKKTHTVKEYKAYLKKLRAKALVLQQNNEALLLQLTEIRSKDISRDQQKLTRYAVKINKKVTKAQVSKNHQKFIFSKIEFCQSAKIYMMLQGCVERVSSKKEIRCEAQKVVESQNSDYTGQHE